MKQQERQELEALESMFITEGWDIFKKDIQTLLNTALGSPDLECTTNDEWQYRRGSIKELRYISMYQEIMQSRLEDTDAQIL
jgi:hypothetical protein